MMDDLDLDELEAHPYCLACDLEAQEDRCPVPALVARIREQEAQIRQARDDYDRMVSAEVRAIDALHAQVQRVYDVLLNMGPEDLINAWCQECGGAEPLRDALVRALAGETA